ncbi:hypothetical protein T439DRAFT_380929 [Meredithblackwellia eburnea MCA 4105]
MPKAARHRKRTRGSRLAATANPLGGAQDDQQEQVEGAQAAAGPATKKVGKKEAEVANLLDKLRSTDIKDRQWASSALSGMLLTLPPVTLRLLLSKNLIGLLIERLTDDDESVFVECLGALRNLAVTSPLSLLSEMNNKRLLLPLFTHHLPLLAQLLPSLLSATPPPPIVAPLPSTPQERDQAAEENARQENRRKLYWDWAENVVYLVWCFAESNTKILASLNSQGGEPLIAFLGSLLRVFPGSGSGDGMDGVEDSKNKKKNKKAEKGGKTVPVAVALAAAQTLYALISSNPPAQAHLLSASNSLTLASFTQILSSPPPTYPTPSQTLDFQTLQIVTFGLLLELANSNAGKKPSRREEMAKVRELLKERSEILVRLVGEIDLENTVKLAREAQAEMDPQVTESQAPSGAVNKLTTLEKKVSTLQLSLEVLGEWCASLDAEGLASARGGNDDGMEDGENEEDDEEEEWGGIVDQEGDVEMGGDEDDGEDDGIIRRHQEPMEEGIDDGSDSDEEEKEINLPTNSISLFSSLPRLLLTLAKPTELSFAKTAATSTTLAATAPKSSLLIPTEAATSTQPASTVVPEALAALSDLLTTVHVRALECLNNVFITLARSKSAVSIVKKDLQGVWEGTLELVLGASQGAGEVTVGSTEEEGEERKMEIVMAGVGAVWGMARVGLGEEIVLTIGDQVTPFLISLFSHSFAAAANPAGEAIRVRIAGALGWIGRRQGVPTAENQVIGTFLLSVLPHGKTPSPFSPTPEVLIQVVDSFIDLYADEDAPYDMEVFRKGGFLPVLQDAVTGVRAATKKIDKKKFPELRSRADGALENLSEFAKYRKSVQ